MPAPVSFSITASASGVARALSQVSSGARKTAADVTGASALIDRGLAKSEAAAKRLATAERSVANAAGSVRLAESQLAAVRSRSTASATQKIAAEERLYAANRRLASSEADVAKAGKESQAAGSITGRITARSAEINKASTSMIRLGTVGAVGLGLVAKAAIDWDSAWAGVTKTVNGTPQQLAAVEDGLRGLARTMPESATQIAQVAENAGQLGIKTPDILAFTKTMVELGDTTNLSSDEAATSFGQLLNVMGDAPQTVGQLGDVLVKLGNNGASTERDILSLGTRLAGAGKQIGLTTPQVLAFGSAISSTGIEAEAGGTAMTQNFFAIDKAVRKGGASLDLYAKTAGMSSDQFRQAWGDDPASATNQFVQGLGRVQASGGSVRGVLDDLGIKSVRQADVYARLAGATKAAGAQTDLLADSLRDAGNAQGALGAEAAIRYATSASKIKIASNKIKDDAISIGGALLPVLSQVTSGIGKAADRFADLPKGAQKGVVGTAAVATGLLLVGGAGLKVTTSVAGAINSLQQLGPTGSRAASGLVGVSKALGVAAVALVAFEAAEAGVAAVQANSKWDSHLSTTLGDAGQAITAAGKGAEQAVPALDGFFKLTTTADLNPFTGKITGLNDAFKALDPQHGDKFFSALTHGLHVLGGPAGSLDLTKQRFDQLDTVLTQVGSTNAPAAAKAFQQIRAQSDVAGHSLDDLVNNQFGDYKKSLQDQATTLGVTLPDSAQVYADWMGGKVPDAIKKAAAANPQLAAQAGVSTAAIEAQKLSLQQLAAQATKTSDALVAASNSEIAVQQALGAAKTSAKTNGKTTNIKTAKGQANQSALNNVISAQHQNVQTEAALPHPDYAAIVKGNESVKKSYIDTARQMGVSGKQAKADADKNFKLPKEITSQVVVKTDKLSSGEVTKLNKELKDVPPETRAKIVTIAETKGAKEAENAIQQIKDKRVIARADGESGGAKDVKKAMDALHDRLVKAQARGDKKGAKDVEDAMERLRSRTVTAGTKGNTQGATKVDQAMHDLDSRTVTAKVNADTSGATEARNAIATVHGKTVNVVINRVSKGDADGGPITHTLPHFDDGGRVQGDGGPREDNIAGIDKATNLQTSWVSVGEWVVDAATTARNSDNLQKMKEDPGRRWQMTPLAAGGPAGLKKGGKVNYNTDARVLSAVVAQFNLDQADDLRERTAANKALEKATKHLNETSTSMLDSVKQLSSTLVDPYRSKTTDAQDFLALMKQGAADLGGFAAQLKQLKAAGLSQGLIDQVTSRGATDGADLAASILAGGQGLIASLNQANASLTKTADSVGIVASGLTGVPKYAGGGLLDGPGTGTSDSILMRGSRGEWMVPEREVRKPGNRAALQAMTAGTPVIEHYAQRMAAAAPNIVVQSDGGYHDYSQYHAHGSDPDRTAQRLLARRKDGLARRGLVGRRV